MLRAQAEHVDQISDVISTLNKLLCRDNTPGRFVTLFYAVLNGERHKVSYVNPGHPPAFLFCRDRVISLCSTGPPLGMFAEVVYGQQEMMLSVNNLLVAYSEGVPKAQSVQDEFFEANVIKEVVAGNRELGVEALADIICESADRFELGNLRTRDDKTAVAVRAV
ncbi:MAG TPA: hypothetical protein DIU35_00690 [Candidatus Latescibacteria bacterium]|nr:hypothetical protein [Candidatus Latescibacterota bacterium]